MPRNAKKVLKCFKQNKPTKPHHQPHPPPKYGSKVQHFKPNDTLPPLDKSSKKFIQEVTGMFLFYARVVNSTMLVTLSSLAAEHATPTERTIQKYLQFLDYTATQDDAIVTYKASKMVLAIHGDASYISELQARN